MLKADNVASIQHYFIAVGVTVCLILILVVRFFQLQILDYDQYSKKANTNRIRKVTTSAPRGLILDRNGKILVDQIAQKTNAFQQNNNILIDNKAKVNSKPQLEIFADDVKCSHGCTIGQLDKEALFYLKSRGIPEKEAIALLTYGFANSILKSVNIPSLKKRINSLISKKLGVDLGFDL